MYEAIISLVSVALVVLTWGWTIDLLAWVCGGCGLVGRGEVKAREAARWAAIRAEYERVGDLEVFERRYGRTTRSI